MMTLAMMMVMVVVVVMVGAQRKGVAFSFVGGLVFCESFIWQQQQTRNRLIRFAACTTP